MGLIEQIIERAKSNKQRIVLPEAEEERTLTAADKVLEQTVKQGDVLSMRGRGRLEVEEIRGLTKKGRTSVVLKRYL